MWIGNYTNNINYKTMNILLKTIGVIGLLVAFSLTSCGQSTFKKGIQVGETGDVLDVITVSSNGVEVGSGVYSHYLKPFTFSGGLTNTSNAVTLGGTLNDDITLANDGALYNFYLQGANTATSRSSRFKIASGVITLQSYEDDSYNAFDNSYLTLNGGRLTLSVEDFTGVNQLIMSDTGMYVTSQLGGYGLSGTTYFGATARDNDFIQKKYADDLIGITRTAGSGLALDGTVFNLGDTITANTTIENIGSTYDFKLRTTNSTSTSVESSMKNGFYSIYGNDNASYSSSAFSKIEVTGSKIVLGHTGFIYDSDILIDGNEMLVTDEVNSDGLYYAADYASGATDLWLPNKKYVDDQIEANGDGVTDGMQDTIDNLWVQVMVDTVDLAAVAWLKSDTIAFPFGYGMNASSDTLGCFDGALMGIFPNQQDTIVPLMIDDATARGTSASVDVIIYYHATPFSASGVEVWSGTLTGTPSVSTTFSVSRIPPNVHIWAEIDGTPADGTKSTAIYLPFEYAKIKQ